jgi:hypothetical protein
MGDGGGAVGDLRAGGGRRWRTPVTGHVAGWGGGGGAGDTMRMDKVREGGGGDKGGIKGKKEKREERK